MFQFELLTNDCPQTTSMEETQSIKYSWILQLRSIKTRNLNMNKTIACETLLHKKQIYIYTT